MAAVPGDQPVLPADFFQTQDWRFEDDFHTLVEIGKGKARRAAAAGRRRAVGRHYAHSCPPGGTPPSPLLPHPPPHTRTHAHAHPPPQDTVIYSAICARLGGRRVAVKVYDKALLQSTKLRAIKREVAMMMYFMRMRWVCGWVGGRAGAWVCGRAWVGRAPLADSHLRPARHERSSRSRTLVPPTPGCPTWWTGTPHSMTSTTSTLVRGAGQGGGRGAAVPRARSRTQLPHTPFPPSVMEHCGCGDLLEKLLREKKAMNERRVAVEVALPCLTALARMHEQRIVHRCVREVAAGSTACTPSLPSPPHPPGRDPHNRDIKLENIFIDDAGRIKLGDFGLTMSMRQESAISPVGTVEYMAPVRVGGGGELVGGWVCMLRTWRTPPAGVAGAARARCGSVPPPTPPRVLAPGGGGAAAG